jgi:glycosyltransferase involved in cell wall biosynthesis
MKTIHLWVSGIEETGGIQHYSACCAEALRELFPESRLRIFSKNDLSSNLATGLHAFGKSQGRLRTPIFAMTGLLWALRERPDFILATHPHFMKALAPLSRLGIPCLAAAHGIEVWGQLSGRLGSAMRAAAGILPVSTFTRDVMHREAGIPLEKMPVVPDTFREHSFSPGPKSEVLLQRYGLSANQPVILTIGRLSAAERYKGQDQMLMSLPAMLRELPNLHYIIGGRGDDEPRLRQIVAGLGLEKHVTFTGFIPESELADHYRLADLYTMPSTGEGFGIVYLESLACGRSCLAGNRDASPEALGDGRWGFVVDPRSPDEIAAAVLSFFQRNHNKPWLHKPEALRAEVSARYGIEAFKSSLSAALIQLLPSVMNQDSGFKNQI